MFCKHCGARTTGVAFCTGCGRPLPVLEQPAPTTAAPAQQAPPPRAVSPQAPPATVTAPVAAQHNPAQQQAPVRAPEATRQTPPPQSTQSTQSTQSVLSAQQRPDTYPTARTSQQSHASPPRRRRTSGGKVLGLVVAVIVLLGGTGGAVWWLLGPDDSPLTSSEAESGSYGSDDNLDALWDRCESGSLTACDELYFSSPSGTEYEKFGATCGSRDGSPGLCAPQGLEGAADNDGFGTDPEKDLLWLGCEDGDMLACDDLYFQSPPGSGYEEFGGTCGLRGEGFGECVTLF